MPSSSSMSSDRCREARPLVPDAPPSCWTTIAGRAGRLGVLCRLVGDGGSLLAVPLDGAKAESLRSSSSVHGVRFREKARGPGDVRGRRTLLSHDRAAGPLVDEVLGAFDLTGDSALEASDCSATAAPVASAASSLIVAAAGPGHGKGCRGG